MPGVKIKIDCTDPKLAAAIAASIGEGLKNDKFMNIAMKTVMVTRTVGDPAEFTRRNQVSELFSPSSTEGSAVYTTELRSAAELKMHPICLEWLNPVLFHTPIVIDHGSEQSLYALLERAFLNQGGLHEPNPT